MDDKNNQGVGQNQRVKGEGAGAFPLLIEAEELARVQQWVEVLDDTWWSLAYFFLEKEDEHVERYDHARGVKTAVRGELAKVSKLAPETVRDMVYMARRITEEDLFRFYPLTRHQLKACLGAGDLWREYAEWAASVGATVKEIRRQIKADRGELFRWDVQADKFIDLARSFLQFDEGDVPAWLVEYAQQSVEYLEGRVREAKQNGEHEKPRLCVFVGYTAIPGYWTETVIAAPNRLEAWESLLPYWDTSMPDFLTTFLRTGERRFIEAALNNPGKPCYVTREAEKEVLPVSESQYLIADKLEPANA